MKLYLDYKDVVKILGVSKNNAYDIIKEMRKDSEFENTFQGKTIKGLVIPSKIFVKYFPNTRKLIKELQ